MASNKPKRESVSNEMPTPKGYRPETLRNRFPEVYAEGTLDLADAQPEKYLFKWTRKGCAIRVLQMQRPATLVPCPNKSTDWDTTNNVFIECNKIVVLTLLHESYAGSEKLTYIDPPHNTGHDVIHPSNFADPLDTCLTLSSQKDAEVDLLTWNPKTSRRCHSAWLSNPYQNDLRSLRQLLLRNQTGPSPVTPQSARARPFSTSSRRRKSCPISTNCSTLVDARWRVQHHTLDRTSTKR